MAKLDPRALRAAEGTGSPYLGLTISEGEETRLEFGPPFTASLVVAPPGPYTAGQTISFQAKLTGVEGKSYRFTRNGRQQPAPKMEIRDAAGKQIGSYAFRYG